MHRLVALAAAAIALATTHCSRTYHPEYHPETRYSFVQHVSIGVPAEAPHCSLGDTSECWRDCMTSSRGEACYLLGVMFETGHGVPRDHEAAVHLSVLAEKLGYAPATIDVEMAAPYLDLWGHEETRGGRAAAAEPDAGRALGTVSSPGGVVVYGSVNGDIYLGR